MRMILFIVFYIAVYVARVADSEDTAIMPRNNVKRIFRQRTNSRTTLDKMFEIPVNQEIAQQTNRRSRQSFLVTQIDDLLQNRRILDSNLARIRRNPRKKRTEDSDSEVILQNDYENDNDADEDNALLDITRLRGFSIWQVPESTVATIDLNSLISPMATQIEMVNPSLLTFERPPLQLENLDSDRSVNERSLSPNLQEAFGITVSDQDLILSKMSNPKFEIDYDVKNRAFRNLNDKVLFSTYPGLFVGIDSPNFSQSQKFQRQYKDYQQDSPGLHNIKKELSNNHLMSFKRKFMLIPISKNLYVLKNVQDNARTGADKIVPKQFKGKNKDNVTSAILSFKAHMHHDVDNVGRVYLQKNLYNHHLSNCNANYLYSFPNSRVSGENENPTKNPTPLYPNFLCTDITSPAHPNLTDTIPEVSIERITPRIPDYENYSSVDSAVESGGSGGKIESYDSMFPPTSSSFEISDGVSLYSEENANYLPNILPAIKLDKMDSFKPDSKNYEDFPTSRELDVEVTTIDFRSTLSIFDDNLDTLITLENVRMYSTDMNKEVFDVTQKKSTEDKSKLIERYEDKDRTDFMDNMSIQYGSALDASAKEDNTSFLDIINFINNTENVLDNPDNPVQDNQVPRTSISSDYSNKKSSNNLNYDNRFMDKVLFSDYTITTKDSFLKTEDYAASTPFLPDTDKWTLQRKQSITEDPRTLLMAIKPLSAELQKLLNAVKLFNQSISNVQNKLCIKKNVKSVRVEREDKEKKINLANPTSNLDYYNSDSFAENFNKQLSNERWKPIPKDINIVNQIDSDLKFKRKTNSHVRFMNKITTPLRKYANSDNKLRIQNDHRNSFKNIKMDKRKFFKSDNVEKCKLPYSKFNRNLKSLTKNYGKQIKPNRQFIRPRFKKLAHTTTPIVIFSYLIGYNKSSKNGFLNKHARNFQSNNNKLIFSSHDISSTFLNTDKDSTSYFLSSNKRKPVQHNVKRAMSTEMYTTDKETEFLPMDTQYYKEGTAYINILALLNMTKKPYVEYPTDIVWTTQNVTESLLLIFTTTEIFQTTTFLPYFSQELTTVAPGTTLRKKKPLKVTESVQYVTEYVTETDFEYYKYSEDYEKRNYTGMYEDYEYEDQENVTSWYEYTTEEITRTTEQFNATIFKDFIGTQLPVTLSAFTVMPITLPLFYTTELTTVPIDRMMTMLTTEIIEESITVSRIINLTKAIETVTTIPITEKLTTRSVIFLTAFLKGITDITLNITIPAAVETSVTETPSLITEKVITEKEIIESTYEILITTISTTQLATTMQITESTTETSISFTITEVNITSYTTSLLTSSSTISTSTETISNTFTVIPITTLELEKESPITQIEKTITEEEITTEATTTEIPITSKIPIHTEATIIIKAPTITKIPTTTKIPTIMKITTTWITTEENITTKETTPIIIKNLTTTKIPITTESLTTTEIAITTEIIKTTTITESLATTKIPTTTEVLMTTEIATTEIPTEILTITETTLIAETVTTIKISNVTETLTPLETERTSIEIRTVTETTTIITETFTTIETPTITEILTLTEFATTTETPIITETTVTKILTTTKIAVTAETPTPLEIEKTSTENQTITEPTETTTITETLTSAETLITTEILTAIEITVTTETSTITETITLSETLTTKIPTTTETLTSTEIKETSTQFPTITGTATLTETLTTTTKVLMPTKIATTIKIPTTETTIITKIPITTEILTTTTEIETTKIITKIPTITGTFTIETTTKIPTTIETLTPVEIETSTETSTFTSTEVSTVIETATVIKTLKTIPITTEIFTSEITTKIETARITETTIAETLTSTKIPTITETLTSTEIATTIESTVITETLTTTKIPITKEILTPIEFTTTIKTPTIIETIKIIETVTTIKIPTTEIIIPIETSTEIFTTAESTAMTETLITTESPITTEMSTPIEITTTYEIPTSIETTIKIPIVEIRLTTSAAIEEMPEVETEYYIAQEPFYKEDEEYEEYDTEIPTDTWYDYEEYETTRKETITVTLSTEATSIYTESILTTTISKTPYLYTEKEITLTTSLETFLRKSASTVVENITMLEAESESTTFSVSESITTQESLTFGSTEEYTLPSSTVFKITTEPLPLEYPTVSSRYTERETKFTSALTTEWHITLPKFVTKPKEVPEIELEKTATSARFSTEVEKLTSFFVSPMPTTLSEEEAIKMAITTTEFPEMETATKTSYEAIVWTTITIPTTEEEVVPYVTSFITSKAETKFELTTSETVGREEEMKQLLQRLDDLKQSEKEMAEREEKLKEKERQWHREKEERKRIMQHEREKAENVTVTTANTTASYVTTATTSLMTAFISTEITTESLPLSTTVEIEITSPILDTFITMMNFSLYEIITISTETIPFYAIEEITSVTYTMEKIEETIELYTTEKSTTLEYITERIEEMETISYIIHTPRITSIVELYNISMSIETVSSYTTEEMYATSYGIVYPSEPSFTSSTMIFAGPISLASEFTTLPTTTLSMYEVSITPMATLTYTTEEIYTTSSLSTYSKSSITSPITFISPITLAIDKFITLSTFETPTLYTLKEMYITSYTEPLFTSSTTSATILVVSTIAEIEYDREIENLKKKLRKKERELEEREELLLEREKKLEKDIAEFDRYKKEFEKGKMGISTTSIEESTAYINLTTPIPPIEKTTIKARTPTQFKKITEKRQYKTTTKIMTSWFKTTKKKKEKEQTTHIFKEIVTRRKEEESATKRICLNVLENTIPLDKSRKDIVTEKICLPYFPEKNEETRIARLSRKLLAFQNKKESRKLNLNFPLRIRYNRRQRMVETTRKISNLQLSHHEWMSTSNESTKPLRQFKGFTRIYEKMREPSLRSLFTVTTDAQENISNNSHNENLLYERRVLDYYENFFSPTTKSMLENVIFKFNLNSEKGNNLSRNGKMLKNVEKREALSTEKNTRFWSAEDTVNISNQKEEIVTSEENFDEDSNRSYTVNVLPLSYNKDKETHEVISTKPDEDRLTMIISDSHIYDYANEENVESTTNYYEFEEKDDLEEQEDLSDETKKKIEEENDDFEDMVEDYMNYEEHKTSTLAYNEKILDNRKENQRTTENSTGLLDRMWPTEKSTIYHLGGTRFWELDFEVTEPPDVFTTTVRIVAITKTTCFHIVLKNNRNSAIETKHYIHYHKRNHDNEMKKSNSQQDTSLQNVTGKNMLYVTLKTKQPSIRAKKLKNNLQKLREPNRYKQNFNRKQKVELNVKFPRNENPVIAKSRKLCGVDKNKSKHQIIKHKDTINISDNRNKKRQLGKSQKSKNTDSDSLKNCTDSCIVNKKSSNKYHKAIVMKTMEHHYSQMKNSRKNNIKTHPDIITDRKNKSTFVSHERKIHDCFNCICDIVSVINSIRSILDRTSFSLEEIKALNCSRYKELQDNVVISMDSDVEEAKAFPQPHYNTESLKGQKYIKLEELEDDFKNDMELDNDHDIISLPGLNLNLPCNQDGDGITWLSSISRPSYSWKRTDGIALFGFVAENGDLELQNVNAKDTGNYTCIMTYIGPDNEEPMEITYKVHLQVVTLPRYILHGENRYHIRSCDERDLDILVTYLPLKLNSVLCKMDICNTYVITQSCSRSQITVNILIVPSRIVKLMTINPKHCNVFCLRAIQDKLSLILSRNLQIFFRKTIIFRLPHYQQRLVPNAERLSFARWKRGKTGADVFGGRSSNVGLFFSCPAGYGLRGTHCVPCNVGTYSEDGISHCKVCPPGTYQPNHGARVCRTCTSPLTKGCYNMLWNSFSAIMVTLASLSVMISVSLLLLCIICCTKKKLCMKQVASIISREGVFQQEKHIEEEPLIKQVSENDEQQWDSEYRVKRKKGKFYINKRRARRQIDRKRREKTHMHEDEWGSHCIKDVRIACPNSYRSHEGYNIHYPKQSCRKGPQPPECDFDT